MKLSKSRWLNGRIISARVYLRKIHGRFVNRPYIGFSLRRSCRKATDEVVAKQQIRVCIVGRGLAPAVCTARCTPKHRTEIFSVFHGRLVNRPRIKKSLPKIGRLSIQPMRKLCLFLCNCLDYKESCYHEHCADGQSNDCKACVCKKTCNDICYERNARNRECIGKLG